MDIFRDSNRVPYYDIDIIFRDDSGGSRLYAHRFALAASTAIWLFACCSPTCNIVVCVLLLLHDIPVAMFPLRCSYSIFLSNVLEGTFLQRLLNAAHRFAKQRTFTAPCPVT